jgi:hypothetical protein
MQEAVRNVASARSIARGQAVRAGTSPPIVGVPHSRRAPLPPPKRTDPRDALRAAQPSASARAREPYLIVTAAFTAAAAIALVLFSSGAVGLPSRSGAPTIATAGLSVTAVDAAREAHELREIARAAAAAKAAALARAEEKNNAEKAGPAPSSPTSNGVEQPSPPGSGATTGDEPTLLDDSTALLEDSANELEGSADQLLEDSNTLLEDPTKELEGSANQLLVDSTDPLLQEADSLELDASLP